VVFLVALPLCLGVALASGAPLVAGLIAGIVGGILVGALSGSHSSVSGPAAGLTAVVLAQISSLGFQAFLAAVVLAGVIQIILGLMKAGSLSDFFPSGVIKGLLAAIGVILILKQLPHLFGHDNDPEGDMAFDQPDKKNTFTELWELLTDLFQLVTTWQVNDFQIGATIIGLASVLFLMLWDRSKLLKKSPVPSALVVVVLGVVASLVFRRFGPPWVIEGSHLVRVPVPGSLDEMRGFLVFPDFSALAHTELYVAAFTLAAVASLETLLNLEAVDKLDPKQRTSPSNRELIVQGVGNISSGMIGGLPVTSVIIRSSVNLNAGAQTKLSAIFHGVLLLVCVAFLPTLLNLIPLSCLAAILLVTGFKLTSPKVVKQMWRDGSAQFLPFAVTVLAIVFTDLLIGVLIGLGVSIAFILRSNLKKPVRRLVEKHLSGEVVHLELPNQVSFLNKAALTRMLDEVPRGGHVLFDASSTDYIDPDVLALIREFDETTGPARGIEVSLRGFKDRYLLEDRTQFVDYSTRELQERMSPAQVLQLLKEGHERFRTGRQLSRDFRRDVQATGDVGQHPLAVVLSCIDSRVPAEIIFDLGVGDIFVARMAGNVTSTKIFGSIEFATAVAGAKLVVVLGHTRCGAVKAAVEMTARGEDPAKSDLQHLGPVLAEIRDVAASLVGPDYTSLPDESKYQMVDRVARANVLDTVRVMRERSDTVRRLADAGTIGIVGAMYDVTTGNLEFLHDVPAAPAVNGER
jgi:carbonic anhydrase/SulP family sulfate permease